MYSNISIYDFKKKLNSDIDLIDIRNTTSYKLEHIPYSRNISKNELMFNTTEYLNKDRIYYIYCEQGFQSKSLCKYLSSVGYNVVNINGGYKNYK